MSALESPGYQVARDQIKTNPVIIMMAAGARQQGGHGKNGKKGRAH